MSSRRKDTSARRASLAGVVVVKGRARGHRHAADIGDAAYRRGLASRLHEADGSRASLAKMRRSGFFSVATSCSISQVHDTPIIFLESVRNTPALKYASGNGHFIRLSARLLCSGGLEACSLTRAAGNSISAQSDLRSPVIARTSHASPTLRSPAFARRRTSLLPTHARTSLFDAEGDAEDAWRPRLAAFYVSTRAASAAIIAMSAAIDRRATAILTRRDPPGWRLTAMRWRLTDAPRAGPGGHTAHTCHDEQFATGMRRRSLTSRPTSPPPFDIICFDGPGPEHGAGGHGTHCCPVILPMRANVCVC